MARLSPARCWTTLACIFAIVCCTSAASDESSLKRSSLTALQLQKLGTSFSKQLLKARSAAVWTQSIADKSRSGAVSADAAANGVKAVLASQQAASAVKGRKYSEGFTEVLDAIKVSEVCHVDTG